MKAWWQSKTLWFSVLLAALGALEVQAQIIPDEYRGGVLIAVAAISAVLRIVTTQPVSK
jgi:hypothetical protein